MGVEDLQAKIESYQRKIDECMGKDDDDDGAERYGIELQRLERKLVKEEAKLPVHPALVFGPIAQTIAAMAAISLGMSVSELPYEMYPFYRLFSTITTFAVICLVTRSGIVYYEYSNIIATVPQLSSEDEYKEAKFEDWLKVMAGAGRPDDWLNNRAHPSHFLSTRHAPPRMFPFPLGKTSSKASIKDELWWEGGNAPHVGHFNKPALKIDFPRGVVAEKWLERAKKRLEIDDQRALWKKRIRSIQILSVVVILSFIYQKAAILLLIYLIYTTLSSEIDQMLQPPRSLDSLERQSQQIEQSMAMERPYKSKPFKGHGVSGMGYVYQPEDLGRKSGMGVNVPIVNVPAPVLMTSECAYLAGPGTRVKGEKDYSAR